MKMYGQYLVKGTQASGYSRYVSYVKVLPSILVRYINMYIVAV
jgi:hypothetical protein